MKAICDVGNLDGFDKQLTAIKRKSIDKLSASTYFPGELKTDFEKEPTNRSEKATWESVYKRYFAIWNIPWVIVHFRVVFRYEASYIPLNIS